MALIIVVRHGRYQAPGLDTPLSDEGRAQIEALGRRLLPLIGEKRLRTVYFSPTQRTQETATILARALVTATITLKKSPALAPDPGNDALAPDSLPDLATLPADEAIILVTHQVSAAVILSVLTRVDVLEPVEPREFNLGHGEAGVVDTERFTYQVIRRGDAN